MKVKRFDIENNVFENVEAIGKVKFVGDDDNVDLTNDNFYYVIGIRNNLLKIIDDTKDYYYYLPIDASSVNESGDISSGFIIVEDYEGKLKELFEIFKIKKETKIKRFFKRLIEWKFNRN